MLFPDGVRCTVGEMAGGVPDTEMVTVIDCVSTMVVLHQDQVYSECIIGIPETVLKEVSLRPHNKPDVQKGAGDQGSGLLKTGLEALSHECQIQSRTLERAVKKAIINHTDPSATQSAPW